MKKKIMQSITFLMSEYKRLKIKKEEKGLTKEEKDTLNRLSFFLGKNKE
mgnify:CR=1 FL=1